MSTLSNMYISETNRLIAIKHYQKHYCGEGLPALDFEADQIRTFVAMAKDNSHRLCIDKTLSTHYLRYLQLDHFHTC